METVISADGTRIAYERQRRGPAVILATGALDDGTENAPLAAELAAHFTTYNYNRRGRGDSGDSGDTMPYALQHEIEDLGALIGAAGGSAHLYGVSSGGGLVLEAAAAGLPVRKVAVYEVPYLVGEQMRQAAQAYVDDLSAAPPAAGTTSPPTTCSPDFSTTSWSRPVEVWTTSSKPPTSWHRTFPTPNGSSSKATATSSTASHSHPFSNDSSIPDVQRGRPSPWSKAEIAKALAATFHPKHR
jgi:alpha-beta hydrolase superfamily lysophospholipase